MQDDLLDDDEDRLILDRSPDETGSQEDLDDLDSDDDIEGTMASDGERIIYPWMKKIHVAGVGKLNKQTNNKKEKFLTPFCDFAFLCCSEHHPLSPHYTVGVVICARQQRKGKNIDFLRISSENALRSLPKMLVHFNTSLVNIFSILECPKSLQICQICASLDIQSVCVLLRLLWSHERFKNFNSIVCL